MRVVHVISGLAVGGAQVMLRKLLLARDGNRTDTAVVSLLRRGEIGDRLRAEGFAVHDLGLTGRVVSPRSVWRIRRLARELEPQIVQGWMYHGNLAASLLARFASGDPGLLWNIRHAVHDLGMEKPLTRFVIRLGGRLSGRPRKIIFNSSVGLDQHVALGYPRDKCVVIPNGFDTEAFRPEPSAGADLRRELDLEPDTLLVGLVGRMHPHKGQLLFLEAAERVARERPRVRFVMAGGGVTGDDPALGGFLRARKLRERVHLLGQRNDTARLIAGLDILCVSSVTEAFPNVLGEAMSCGIPCVTTDVGDAARVLGGLGEVVPPSDSGALAAGLLKLLDLSPEQRRDLGNEGRRRVSDHFGIAAVAAQYAELYASF